MKNCTPLWREAHFQVKMFKNTRVRTTFGSSDLENVHAVVARSTFPSQNVQNTRSGPLLEVQMSKKCTPFWREAHFEVNVYKEHTILGPVWRFRCRFASLHYITLHYTPLHSTALHYTTLHYTTLHLYTSTFHYAPLHFTTLNHTTLY